MYERKKQHDEAKKLSATRLYQADIAYYKVTNGGNSLIEDELGGRGVSAINALYEKDVIRDLNGTLLVSNLDSVDRKSGINICASPYYDSIIKYLTDIDKRRLGFFSDRAKLTKIYCSSKSESLPSDK
ncbi:MAG: hypothetical protein ACTHJR_09580 [Sphingomonas sp.]|uniref:hypothetical protein n=1 Tax=Sphingomonas sp. TaxID=28214 RepID=UPI003F7EA262